MFWNYEWDAKEKYQSRMREAERASVIARARAATEVHTPVNCSDVVVESKPPKTSQSARTLPGAQRKAS